jgi:hypothetical protein
MEAEDEREAVAGDAMDEEEEVRAVSTYHHALYTPGHPPGALSRAPGYP